jgi:hypothetical protein
LDIEFQDGVIPILDLMGDRCAPREGVAEFFFCFFRKKIFPLLPQFGDLGQKRSLLSLSIYRIWTSEL